MKKSKKYHGKSKIPNKAPENIIRDDGWNSLIVKFLLRYNNQYELVSINKEKQTATIFCHRCLEESEVSIDLAISKTAYRLCTKCNLPPLSLEQKTVMKLSQVLSAEEIRNNDLEEIRLMIRRSVIHMDKLLNNRYISKFLVKAKHRIPDLWNLAEIRNKQILQLYIDELIDFETYYDYCRPSVMAYNERLITIERLSKPVKKRITLEEKKKLNKATLKELRKTNRDINYHRFDKPVEIDYEKENVTKYENEFRTFLRENNCI